MKKTKGVKVTPSITIPVLPPKAYEKQFNEKLGKKLAKQLQDYAKLSLKEVQDHFKTDKYNLDFSVYSSEIANKILGPVDWYFASLVVGKGLKVKTAKNGRGNTQLMITRK